MERSTRSDTSQVVAARTNGGRASAPEEASSGALVASALRDTQELARNYVELVRIDAREQLTQARRSLVMLLSGLTLLLVSVPFLLWSGGAGLSLALDWPPWVGMLLLSGLVAVLGTMMLTRARPDEEEEDSR